MVLHAGNHVRLAHRIHALAHPRLPNLLDVVNPVINDGRGLKFRTLRNTEIQAHSSAVEERHVPPRNLEQEFHAQNVPVKCHRLVYIGNADVNLFDGVES